MNISKIKRLALTPTISRNILKHLSYLSSRLSTRLSTQFSAQQLLRTRDCIICGQYCQAAICTLCTELLPWISNYCHFCFKSIKQGNCCGQCLNRQSPYQQAILCFQYARPISTLLQQLKYQHRLDTVPILSDILSEKIIITGRQYDAIIPIPLHRKRLRKRGFNQAAELAKHISQKLNIPIYWTALKRQRNTAPQVNLSETQRKRNLKDAFIMQENINQIAQYPNILLIDDVITSGSTISSAAICIKKTTHCHLTIAAIAKTANYNNQGQ